MIDKPNRIPEKPTSDSQRLAGIAAKGVLELASGGGYLVDLVKLRKDIARDAVRKKDEETLDAFFADLFDGSTALDPSIADAMIDDRDFHCLVRACIADIESEKREAYAALARSIATQKVSGEWNRHFIISLKEMSLKELEFLRSALVAKHHCLMPNSPVGGSLVRESDFLKIGQPGSFQSIAINKLTTNGFVHESKLSPTGESFVRACAKDLDLTPSALGYKAWSNQNVAIISYELGDSHVVSVTMDIEGLLRNYQIKSSIVAITRGNQQQARVLNTQGILLLGQNTNGLEEHTQALAKYTSKVPLIVVETSEKVATLSAGIVVAKTIRYESDFKETRKKIIAAILEFRNPQRPMK